MTNSLADIVVKATPGPYRFKFNDIFVTDPSDGDDMVLACVGKSFGLRSSVYTAPKAHWPEIQAVGELLALAPTLATLVLEAREALRAFMAGADEGFVSVDVDSRLRATLAKLESL